MIANQRVKKSIIDLARDSFEQDRFHRDPNIPNRLASEIKGQWVENFFKKKRGDNCFVIMANKKQVKGFLLTLKKQNEIVIDLIAVDKKYRKQGIARKLIEGMINHYQDQYLSFTVGTQINNKPSTDLYKKCGFLVAEYALVWHYFNKQLV